jgi:ATP-dependent Lhr-like helicase
MDVTATRPAQALDAFHPAVAAWFRRTFAAPTGAQALAWPHIKAGRSTLVAAPTGSGKTLTAFLCALDDLVRDALAHDGALPDATLVVYVSPLKALSNDIHVNLDAPLAGIAESLARLGLPVPAIRTAVRTGDTTQSERAALRKRAPHILVTTPESLYVLLSSTSGRQMLSSVRSVIVDEIHALASSKRGSHLALSLERLDALTGRALPRIGLSATQKPIEAVARFLVGGPADAPRDCTIVDTGHTRERDLALELPNVPLEPVMATDVWDQVYDRIAALAAAHRTTLVFVNTRRTAERMARHLAERLGKDAIAAHHGSLAKEHRFEAEQRLKRGELKLLVATASLELGIDIGDVDLVCQVGSPRGIAPFLQRVGRSGHHVGGVPKGRLFPLSRDELVECAALLDCVRRGELDTLRIPEAPLDVLAQQIVAEVACTPWQEDALYAAFTRAAPYARLSRERFDDVLKMLAEGFTSRRGVRGAYLHRDVVGGTVRGRRNAMMTATTSGGTIPDMADYAVLLEPQGIQVGTVNEDFAVEPGRRRVPARQSVVPDHSRRDGPRARRGCARPAAEHSVLARRSAGTQRRAVGSGRPAARAARRVARRRRPARAGRRTRARADRSAARRECERGRERRSGQVEIEVEADRSVAQQCDRHRPRRRGAVSRRRCAGSSTSFGYRPKRRARSSITSRTRGAGRAADPAHARDGAFLRRVGRHAAGDPFAVRQPHQPRVGARAAQALLPQLQLRTAGGATDDAIVLSLSLAHSFALDEVWRYLRSASAEHVLVQALLDAPLFGVRWRWNATTSLALPRFTGGRRTAPQLQRMKSDDLLATVFPDQAACLENVVGEREIPIIRSSTRRSTIACTTRWTPTAGSRCCAGSKAAKSS